MVISFVGGYLFLPEYEISLLGPFDYEKMAVASYSVIIATLIFNAERFTSFRPNWLDFPMIFYCCISPVVTALNNDLTWYDGFSDACYQFIKWGAPYFLGRMYLSSLEGLRKLAVGILIGGLLYVPLCLYEVRMSPQLHNQIYGFYALRQFSQAFRWGGYRPSVFLRHGLSLGNWMMATTLIAFILWRTKAIIQILDIPMKWIFWILVVNIIAVKSLGAWLTLTTGLLIFVAVRLCRKSAILLAVILSIIVYYGIAASGNFDGQGIVDFFSENVSEERAQSLSFRFENEELLSERAREQPMWGWGGYGRNRVIDGWGTDLTITDSWWVITFGIHGAAGLISLGIAMLLPVVLFIRRYPGRTWGSARVAPAAALAIVVVMYMLDNALNNQYNPVFALVAGSIEGLVLRQPEPSLRTAANKFSRSRVPRSIY
ncbi:MAG: O-antigen ligase domain-containing protein [Elainellaceae cyanobacterium]